MIFVCGCNKYGQCGVPIESSEKKIYGDPDVTPPRQLPIDPSTILSYSSFWDQVIIVTRDGQIKAMGFNGEGQIHPALPREALAEFTDVTIKDGRGRVCTAISAFSCDFSLYLVSSPVSKGKNLLALSYPGIDSNKPIFLKTITNPIALFGGSGTCAAIDDEKGIIFIPQFSKIKKTSTFRPSFLPRKERPISVVCGHKFVMALSSRNNVFIAEYPISSTILTFNDITELKGKQFCHISGAFNHYFAVSTDGQVYGLGDNDCGQLGAGKKVQKLGQFTEITPLRQFNIVAAYAGCDFSVFQTQEGKLLACGTNQWFQLPIDTETNEDIRVPTETIFNEGVTFAILGNYISVYFVNCLPENTPNKKISTDET